LGAKQDAVSASGAILKEIDCKRKCKKKIEENLPLTSKSETDLQSLLHKLVNEIMPWTDEKLSTNSCV
jgi:hypothetical protein